MGMGKTWRTWAARAFLASAVCALGACDAAGIAADGSPGTDRGPHNEETAAADSDALAAGIAALEREDLKLARSILRPLAVRGHAEAQTQLGLSYFEGLSIFDPSRGEHAPEALRWSLAAAEQGHAKAQAQVAMLMLSWPEKLGLQPEQMREGLEWGEKAARQGDTNSMALLELIYRNHPEYRDEAKAAYWEKAREAAAASARSASAGNTAAPAAAATGPTVAPAADSTTGSAGTAGGAMAADARTPAEPAPDRSVPAANPSEMQRAAQIAQAAIEEGSRYLEPATATATTLAGRISAPRPIPTSETDGTVQQSGGTRIVTAPDGTRAYHFESGNTRVDSPDGTRTLYGRKGLQVVSSPDGTETTHSPDGTRMVDDAGGARAIFDADGRLRQLRMADGVEITYYEDGGHLVGGKQGIVHYLATGRVCHVQAPDGTQIRFGQDGSSTVFPPATPE